MQISNISNTNFGRIYLRDTAVHEGVNLSRRDKRVVRDVINALNSDVAQNISVYAEIGKPAATGNRKSIRILTSPTTEDMAIIKSFRPRAERRDYKRRSHWVRLYDREIYDKLAEFIYGQKGFIHHCTIDPHHSSKPFGTPMWQPSKYNNCEHSQRPIIKDF